MAERDLPGGLGLRAGWAEGADHWGAENDENLLKLSVLCQCTVLNTVAVEPGGPADGDLYLLSGTANAGKIAVRDEGAWVYLAPVEGWLIYDRTANGYKSYDGAAWNALATGGGGGALADLSDVDTTTDAPTEGQALVWNTADSKWKPGTVAGGGGGGGGGSTAMPVLRASDIVGFNAASVVVPFPAGSAAGDVAVIFISAAWDIDTPAGWVLLDIQVGSNTNGALFGKELDAGDISDGDVTINLSGSYNGTAAIAVMQGDTVFGIRLPTAGIRDGAGVSTIEYGSGSPKAGDYIVVYAGNRGNSTNTFDLGTLLETDSTANSSGALYGEVDATKVGVSTTVSFSTAGSGYYVNSIAFIGISSGGSGGAAFRGARVHNAADYARSGGSNQAMIDTTATVEYDTDSWWDSVNQRFNVPAGVTYAVMTAQRAVTSGTVGLRLAANIGGVDVLTALVGDVGETFIQGSSGVIACSEGDWFQPQAYGSGGYTLQGDDVGWTWAEIRAAETPGAGGGGGVVSPVLVQMKTIRNDATLTLDDATTAGNLLLFVFGGYTGGEYSGLTGFNLVSRKTYGGNNRVAAFWKKADGTETAWSLSGTDNQSGVMYEYANAKAVVDGETWAPFLFSGLNFDAPFMDTPYAGAVRHFAIEQDGSGTWTVDAQTGLTVDYEATNGSNHNTVFGRLDPGTWGNLTGSAAGSVSDPVGGFWHVVGSP